MKTLSNVIAAAVFTPFIAVAIMVTGAALLLLWPLMPVFALFAGEDTDSE